MKRFHATCTNVCREGGIGGWATMDKGKAYRVNGSAGFISCTLVSFGEKIDVYTYACVVEVVDADAPKLLAAGLKPVDEQPQQNPQTPAPSPTETKAMQPQTQQADATQQPQSWMQRLRDDAKNSKCDDHVMMLGFAIGCTMLLAGLIAGIVYANAKQDVPWIVFLGIIAPMVATGTLMSWGYVYAIATRDYVPPVRVAKVAAQTGGMGGQLTLAAGCGGGGGIGITVAPPRRRSIIGRFIWWAVSSATYTALGYAACWAQSNWSAICFDLGAFLQRVAQ